jgi:hypothetical protein
MSSNIQPVSFAFAIGGWEDQYTQMYAEGATQSFVIGALLKLSSGLLVPLSSVTAPTVAGVALAKATGTTGSQATPALPCILPLASVVFSVSVDATTTNDTAALGTGYPSQFNVGTNYQLLLDSTSGNYYLGSGTSNPVWQLLGYDQSQASVINGRVYARMLTSQTIYT